MNTEATRCPSQTEEQAALLLDYCAGRLGAEQRAALDAHFEMCAECRMFKDRQSIVWDALDAWEAGPAALDFNRRLYSQLEAPDPWYGRAWRWASESLSGVSWKPAFPAAALVALWILLVNPAAPPPQETSKGDQIEQVERTLEDLDMLQQLKLPAQ